VHGLSLCEPDVHERLAAHRMLGDQRFGSVIVAP
jgi:hypothetical protein